MFVLYLLFICLECLTLGLCNSYSGNIGDTLLNKRFDYAMDSTQDHGTLMDSGFKFQFDDGNPDVHGDIERPCQVYDITCIRVYFANHSKCKMAGRPIPDPFFISQVGYYLPSVNITQTYIDHNLIGLNDARVIEFYINKATNNLIIAVTFNNLSMNANTQFAYNLKGREPVVTRSYGIIQYGILTLTVIIPNLQNLTLEKSEITTYAEDDIFNFDLGPSIATSTDPEVSSAFATLLATLPTIYLEQVSYVDPIVVTYIQNKICDFGLAAL